MNQHLYRIVFNKARGCLMAVAETAAAQGKAGERRNTAGGAADSGAGYPTRLASGLQTLALAMASAALLTSVAVAPQAQAQIVADPSAPANQRPTVLTTGSGNNIPLVNIQTPSAAGVSRNTYSQFDVQNNGAVLNNSRTNVQTQLGGWVQGNPWLATGSAKIILNEVNSNNPSQLRGAIEVAGQRAEVVIANPAGILVDGAGFINTSRATLTTGTPILNGGSLDGYRVQTGTITITGAGLDASSTDYTAILARAVSLSAGIWANTLNITTGANQISVDAGTTTATATTAIAGTGSVPSFALDVSAIGGMYAGKITLIGTEAGLGVRNAGVLVANAGDLVLGNDGWLSNTGSLTASQNLSAQTSGAITNSGTVYANGNTAVTSGGDTNNTGLIAALGNTTVTSGGSITSASGSVLAAGLAADNTVGSSGNLAVTATGTATLAGQSLAGADVQLTGSDVDISHGQLSGRNLGLAASTGDVTTTGATIIASQTLTASTTQTLRTDGAVFSANQLTLAAHDLSNAGGQLLQTGTGDLALNLAGNLDNTGGTIATNGKLLVSTSTLSNTQGHISANQSVNIAASASLDNTDGTIGAAQDLRLAGGNLINTRGTVQTTSGNVTLAVADLDNSAGQITAAGNLAIQAVNVSNTGTLYASGSQTLTTSGTVSNSGVIAALGDTTITAQNLHSTSSSLLAAGLQADGSLASTGDLHITTTQGLVANGQNIAAGSVRLDSASLDLSGSQTSAVNLALTASAGNLNASHATLVAAQTLSASSTQTLTTDGAVLSAHQLNLGAHDLSNVGGQLLQTGTGDMALQVTDTLDNSHGVIASNSQNLVLSAQTLTNAGGQIQHAGTGTLSVNTTTATDNSAGAITSNGDVHVDAYSLRNQGGSLQAAGNLTLTTTAAVDNSASGQLGAGGDVALVTGSMDNTQGSITAGGKLSATATGTIANTGGLLAAIGDVTLTGAHLNNSQGTIASVQNALSVSTSGTTANDGGSIQAALDVTLQNAGLSNAGSSNGTSRITGRNISIDTQGQSFNNHLGTLVASQSATLQTGALNNDAGLVQAGTSLNIDTHGQTLTNTHAAGYANGAGGLSAQGAMALATGDLDNAAGFIGAGGALTATTAQVRNTASSGVGGQIVGNASVTFNSTGFDNRGGQVQALGNVSINAGSGGINNTASLLRSAGTLSLAANTVTNSNTQGANQGIEGYNVTVAANTIANDTGAIRADNNATLSSSGSINNSQGLVSAGNTLTVQDLGSTKTLAVTNTSGKQIALQALSLNAASLTGNGKMLSQGNLAITLTSDYNNTDEVTANGNASISTTGNITNSGTLQAGNTLSLSASNIDNTATGTLTATTTQLTASNTLTNRGLIDGTETQINAGTLNNIGTGRIYGDHISVAAGTVNNDAETAGGVTTAATIAARSRLDIGATNINNSNGALIFSAGDLAMGGRLDANRHATGAAGTVTNSGSTIQALGNLAIGTATLNNLNPSFAYALTPGASTSKTDYISTDGSSVYVESDFAWVTVGGLTHQWNNYKTGGGLVKSAPSTGGVLPSSPYADPKYKPFYDGPDAYVAAYTITHGSGSNSGSSTDYPAVYSYDNTSSIWATFGVTAPTISIPVYPDHGSCDSCEAPTAEEIAAYEASTQPWKDLQLKINAFRSTVQSGLMSFQTYRSYTETTQSAEVTASTPGQILSGGSLSLDVSSTNLNDNSRIIAGGALNITGVAVNNHATTVTANNTRNGTISSWGVNGEDCDIFGCDPTYGWNTGSYTQSTPTTLTLGLGVTQWNTGGSAASTSVSNKMLTGAVQGAQTTGGVHVLIASLANDAIGSLVNAQTPNSTRAATPVPSSVPRLTQVSTASGGTVQSVLPNTSLPTASLFHTAPSSTSHYLVETDPAYANYRTWLSSDALLTALSYDPATVQKRLGDGFYEQQLIREQVAELTGHRFLTGYQNDEAQYQALLASGATYAKQWNLVPGIALSPAQMAQLTTDMVWLVEKTVTLADGSTQKVLVPQLYAVVRDGDLSNTGALLSGGSVNLNLTGDLTNSGTIAGRSVVSLTADNINNLGGRISGSDVAVQAATDLNNIGGQISASNNLLATAGRDIHVTTTTQSTITGTNSFTGIDRVAGLYVTGTNGVPGTLVAAAGRDINLTGAILSSAGTATLQAANNLNLQAVTQAESINATRDADNYTRFAQSQAVGTQVQASGALTLSAGNDLSAVGANVNSSAGATTLAAGHDVRISAARQTSSLDTASYAEGSSMLGSGNTRSNRSGSADNAQASSIGGNTVTVVAGHDIAVTGSLVVSDAGTTLVAQNNIAITSDTNRSASSSFFESKGSGFSMDGGINIGSKQQSTDSRGNGTTAAGSTVASLTGDVAISAGQQYTQVGSAVQTPAGNISIQAQDVAITEARETSASSTVTKQSSSGLTLGMGGSLIAAMQGVENMADAAGQTSNKRMQALAAVTAGLTVANAMGDMAKSGGKPSVNISLSYGQSSSTSTTSDQSDSAAGSTVAAGGNVSIVATGAGKDSNLLVQGGSISAGNTTTLKADNDIVLQAAQNTSSEHSTSQGSSSSIGVSYGTDGWNVSASASKSKGKGDGSDLGYTNTTVSGGKAVNISSGGDTTLAGATITAPHVSADIGGNLTIQSLQDQSSYHSSSSSMGGSVTVGTGASASASMSKTRVDSEFNSVVTQSGIRAGDGGFQVAVKGDTTLTGGVISSTQAAVDQNLNSFSTGGTLTTTDLQNKAEFSAQSVSASVGTGGASGGVGSMGSNASSTTQAGITGIAGNTAARTGDAETGVKNVFDKDKVQADVQAQASIMQAFSQQAPMAVANYAASQMKPIDDANRYENLKVKQSAGALSEAETKQLNQMEASGYTPDKAQADLNNPQYKADYDTWKEGGTGRVIAHTVMGALGGGVSGALGAGAAAEAAPQLNNLQNGLETSLVSAGLPPGVAHGLANVAMQGVATGIGAVASGGNIAGATAALGVDANNRQQDFANFKKELAACKANPSMTGCATTLKMAGATVASTTQTSTGWGVATLVDSSGATVSYLVSDASGKNQMILQPQEYDTFKKSTLEQQQAKMQQSQPMLDATSALLYWNAGQYGEAASNLKHGADATVAAANSAINTAMACAPGVDCSTAASAGKDVVRAASNVVVGGVEASANLFVYGDIPGTPGYVPFLDGFKQSYDNPAFGTLMTIGLPLAASSAIGTVAADTSVAKGAGTASTSTAVAATDSTATSAYSSAGTKYEAATYTDTAGNVLPAAATNGTRTATGSASTAADAGATTGTNASVGTAASTAAADAGSTTGATTTTGGAAAPSNAGPSGPVFNPAGAARQAQYSNLQQGASLSDTISTVAGQNPVVTYTTSGKTLYTNPTTGMQVVYDNAGNYFRVEDTNVIGPLRYTDQFGKPIPNNVPLIKPNNTVQIGVPADVRNTLTHFNNTD